MLSKSKSAKMLESRVRLGERQRAQTRDAILAASMRVFQQKSPDAAVIGDLIGEAGVSRGSFYNHFKDVEAVIVALALKLSEEFNDAIRMVYGPTPDPAERISIGIRHHIRRAAEDPRWGWVIVRVASSGDLDQRMRRNAAPDIDEGLRSGRFPSLEPQILSDIIMGTVFEGMKTVLEGDAVPGHAEKLAAGVLRAFGLSFGDAEDVANRPIPSLRN